MEVRQTAPFRQMVEEEVGRDASPYMAGIFRLQEQNGIVFLRARQQHGLKNAQKIFFGYCRDGLCFNKSFLR